MVFNTVIVFVARIILGLLFIFTAVLKLVDLKGFYLIFLQYGLLKPKIAKPLAYAHPFIELIVGLLLIYDANALWIASLAGLGMMITATVFVIYALIKKLRMKSCGCYGTAITSPASAKKVIENIVWIIALLYVFLSTI